MELTQAQATATTLLDQSLAVIAQAGTGKTRVLVERVKNLLGTSGGGLKFRNILVFTFTEKAAGEIRSRLFSENIIAPEEELSGYIGTIHGFCASLLKRFGPRLGLDPNFAIMAEAEQAIARNSAIHRFLLNDLHATNGRLHAPLATLGYAKLSQYFQTLLRHPDFLNRSDLPEAKGNAQLILQACASFSNTEKVERLKKGRLGFDDLETLSLELLERFPDISQILLEQYRHVLVDEFQDINPVQARLIQHLHQPTKNFLFIVGDPRQSIYRFRRADSKIFLQTQENILAQHGRHISLNESFRLPAEITQRVNAVFSKLFVNHEPLQSANNHEGTFSVVTPSKEKNSAERLRELEAEFIAQYLLEQNLSLDDLQETAILFRSGKPMDLYRQILQKHGIPCQLTRSAPLLEQPLVRELLHLMATLGGDHHPITQIGLLRSRFVNISENFISTLRESKLDTLTSPHTPNLFSLPADQTEFQRLRDDLTRWGKLVPVILPSQLFARVRQDLNLSHDDDFLAEQFLLLIKNIEAREIYCLHELVRLIQEIQDSGETILTVNPPTTSGSTGGSTGGAVQLMTIHAAKGLEFQRVLLPQLHSPPRPDSIEFGFNNEIGLILPEENPTLVQGLKVSLEETPALSQYKARELEERTEESKRLLYVAMTRSKKDLMVFLREPTNPRVKINETKNWNDWLWLLLPEDCRQAINLTKYAQKPLAWSGLAARMDQALQFDAISINSPSSARFPSIIPSPLEAASRGTALADARKGSQGEGARRAGEGYTRGANTEPPIHSVSQIESLSRCAREYRLKFQHGIEAGEGHQAQKWGLLVHEVFQFLDWQQQSNTNTVIAQALKNQCVADTEQNFEKRLRQLITAIGNHPEISHALKSTPFQTELPFMIQTEVGFLHGRMDRLIVTEESTLIMDFKTDHVDTLDAAKARAQDYWGQLATYALAANKITKKAIIQTALIFINGPYLVTRHWDQPSLQDATEQIKILLTNLDTTQKLTTIPLPKPNTCQHCSYAKTNYCGWKNG